jgi:catechol 2,3-dioxygenase-like lactoylglutathione lyase family enzyme
MLTSVQIPFAKRHMSTLSSECGVNIQGGSAMTETRTDTHRVQSTIFSPDTSTAVVRYQVHDLDRAVEFYTRRLGFQLKHKAGPVATVARGDLHLLLSGPESSGSRPMPDGRRQEPGGWNRIVLYVDSIDRTVDSLKTAGSRFRNQIESGPGGKQIQIEDLDGNPIELHEAPAK